MQLSRVSFHTPDYVEFIANSKCRLFCNNLSLRKEMLVICQAKKFYPVYFTVLTPWL